MNPTYEYLTIFTLASMRKHFDTQAWGIPVTYMQQEQTGNVNVKDEIQIQTSIRFPKVGDKFYVYGLVHTRAWVKTKDVPTDVYYHVRAKARVTQILTCCIPLYKIGGSDLSIYDQTQWGILRWMPNHTLTIVPTSVDVPNSSAVDVMYEIQHI